jgi:hypothetical protein
MDIISAYREAGTYRGAAAICGTTHNARYTGDPGHRRRQRGLDAPRRRPARVHGARASGIRGSARSSRRGQLRHSGGLW